MHGVPSGRRDTLFFRCDYEAVVYTLIARTSRVPCIMSLFVIYSQLLALTSLSLHSISPVFIIIIILLMLFHAFAGRNSGTASPGSNHSPNLGALDPSNLEVHCQQFLAQGLASSTRSSYLSGQKFYDLLPADEWTLCLFLTFLTNTVHHSTINVYLSMLQASYFCFMTDVF